MNTRWKSLLAAAALVAAAVPAGAQGMGSNGESPMNAPLNQPNEIWRPNVGSPNQAPAVQAPIPAPGPGVVRRGRGPGPYYGAGVGAGLGYYYGSGYGYNSPYYDRGYVEPPRYRPRYRDRYVGRVSSAHVEWCYDRYRSYRASDNTYQPTRGPRRECVSPYS